MLGVKQSICGGNKLKIKVSEDKELVNRAEKKAKIVVTKCISARYVLSNFVFQGSKITCFYYETKKFCYHFLCISE